MEPPNEFLSHLVGRWELEGLMGDIPLRQSVEGKWVLGGLFIELYFNSTVPAPEGQKLYEAIYYIGYNEKHDRYVMHLLDTTAVALPYIVGIGEREDNSIRFVFDSDSPFTNRFTWNPAQKEWRFELTHVRDGQLRNFATKRMIRRLT